MNGRERVARVFAGEPGARPPVLPIMHTGLAPLFGVALGEYFTCAEVMAHVTVRGYRAFGFDGVQLSLGVAGEAEALGARVAQPVDAPPVLRERLLADVRNLEALRRRDPTAGGRMPLFFEAVQRVAGEIGEEAFILATLRGPLLAGAQLRGVEAMLIDMVEAPDAVAAVLDFTTDVAARLGAWLRASGAHGLILGEATCSPNFIAPAMYRRLVLPQHRRLVRALRQAGWQVIGMHICGNTLPIIEDVIATGVDFMDVDYQVPADQALARARGRVVLRGNLDPSALFRFGAPEQVRASTRALRRTVDGARWIMSSGCDIPPGTPTENVAAFVEAMGA
ncbi:MAG: uroporphyrinogen decarboxylase family protein [Anaerolineae bacterium]|nr:uroporphyrinogen decarboxylase family protein [Anaerolineae bacterium]